MVKKITLIPFRFERAPSGSRWPWGLPHGVCCCACVKLGRPGRCRLGSGQLQWEADSGSCVRDGQDGGLGGRAGSACWELARVLRVLRPGSSSPVPFWGAHHSQTPHTGGDLAIGFDVGGEGVTLGRVSSIPHPACLQGDRRPGRWESVGAMMGTAGPPPRRDRVGATALSGCRRSGSPCLALVPAAPGAPGSILPREH